MSKHTKGPWYLTWETSCVHTADEGSSIVCDDNATKGDLTLIAAAPELLEAATLLVERAHEIAECDPKDYGPLIANQIQWLSEAIAKAEQGDGE